MTSKERQVAEIDDSVFELIDFIGDTYGKERAVVLRSVDIYERLLQPFGGDYNHQLMLSLIAPEEIQRMYDIAFLYNQRIIEHCSQHNVLIAMQGQDFCMNSGCILSPDSLRELYFPFMKKVNELIVQNEMIPFFKIISEFKKIK
ncbi:MAG: hypothetical protein RR415_11195 [Ruthenibacterium sp.]